MNKKIDKREYDYALIKTRQAFAMVELALEQSGHNIDRLNSAVKQLKAIVSHMEGISSMEDLYESNN